MEIRPGLDALTLRVLGPFAPVTPTAIARQPLATSASARRRHACARFRQLEYIDHDASCIGAYISVLCHDCECARRLCVTAPVACAGPGGPPYALLSLAATPTSLGAGRHPPLVLSPRPSTACSLSLSVYASAPALLSGLCLSAELCLSCGCALSAVRSSESTARALRATPHAVCQSSEPLWPLLSLFWLVQAAGAALR
jgi:hypothetical protein